ncbi:uncharacterized protein LOC133516021 [Cydia pomonella]|uniref:uncharacterized protein LOC133516021 n=1 Tax=Cydia pomonella TaxID=82600 RepID=UPI002ADE119C|nr:uncharacterized protein LOC133516021 [Cydia pomonella]
MPNHRNACTICFLILIFITCANGTSSNERGSRSKSEEEQKKTIERERNSSDEDNSDSGVDRSDAEVDSGPKITRGILRDQVANGEASDERRKKRHAFFYRAEKPVRWEE